MKIPTIKVTKVIDRDVRKVFLGNKEEAKTRMLHAAEVGKEAMKQSLDSKSKFGTGTLANSIEISILEGCIGLGDISILPKYWYVQNYGKYFGTETPYIPGRPTEDPDTPRRIHGQKGTPFRYQKGYKGSIVPMNPIVPKNYIEDGIAAINNEFA